jgi:hypothetical protein
MSSGGSRPLFGEWQPSLDEPVAEVSGLLIDDETVDIALDRWLDLVLVGNGWTRDRVDTLKRRFGWAGATRPTLAELGDELGISRERFRQIEKKASDALRAEVVEIPILELALELLESEAPVPSSRVGEVLLNADIATRPLSASGILAAFELAGLETDLYLDREVLTRPGLPWLAEPSMVQLARRSAHRHGITSLAWVVAEVQDEMGIATELARVGASLEEADWPRFLDGGWFWDGDIGEGRFRLHNVVVKMLCACGPLSAKDIHEGLARQQRLGRFDTPPPVAVLEEFFAAHPDFELDETGDVLLMSPRHPREVLGETEYVMYEVLRASPDRVLDRQAFRDGCLARGMNVNTFTQFTTYSPILDHPALDRWALRGVRVSPVTMELMPRRTRVARTTYTWTSDGLLEIDTVLNGPESPVIGIPSPVLPLVQGRSFRALDSTGVEVGVVKVDDDSSSSWGYGRYTQRVGAAAGDTLRASFDLARSFVMIEVTELSGRARSLEP